MREIKFRAWDENRKMFHPWGFNARPGTQAYFEGPPHEVGMIHEQFTGLMDKNGREIYEGDILEISGDRWTVEWEEMRAGWFAIACGKFYSYGLSKASAATLEVIGNRWENPELLKNAEKKSETPPPSSVKA